MLILFCLHFYQNRLLIKSLISILLSRNDRHNDRKAVFHSPWLWARTTAQDIRLNLLFCCLMWSVLQDLYLWNQLLWNDGRRNNRLGLAAQKPRSSIPSSPNDPGLSAGISSSSWRPTRGSSSTSTYSRTPSTSK